MRQPNVHRRIRSTTLAVLSLVVLTFSGYEGSAPVEAVAQETAGRAYRGHAG